jgi:hypothetical protein
MREWYSSFNRLNSARAWSAVIVPSTACDSTSRISMRYSGGGRMSAVTSLATKLWVAIRSAWWASHSDTAPTSVAEATAAIVNSLSFRRIPTPGAP